MVINFQFQSTLPLQVGGGHREDESQSDCTGASMGGKNKKYKWDEIIVNMTNACRSK